MIKAVHFGLGDTLIVEEAMGGRHLWEVEQTSLELTELHEEHKHELSLYTFSSTHVHIISSRALK